MSKLAMQVLSTAVLAVGELLVIYAEVQAAYHWERLQQTRAVLYSASLMAVGGTLLIAGYVAAYRAWEDLWKVGVISLVSILVAEPVVTYVVSAQRPGLGAVLGFVLGSLGLFCALFIPR